MLVTLPLTRSSWCSSAGRRRRRSRANWQALVVLSAHFLDVVQGLATLRAFNRGQAQIPKIAEATDDYRVTTMGTLRLAFLSGVVLDLATTLSSALVAVTLGARLAGGSIGLRPALTVLMLAPELNVPIRPVGTLFHASTDGLAGAERILAILEATDRARQATRSRPTDHRPATRRRVEPDKAIPRRRPGAPRPGSPCASTGARRPRSTMSTSRSPRASSSWCGGPAGRQDDARPGAARAAGSRRGPPARG